MHILINIYVYIFPSIILKCSSSSKSANCLQSLSLPPNNFTYTLATIKVWSGNAPVVSVSPLLPHPHMMQSLVEVVIVSVHT